MNDYGLLTDGAIRSGGRSIGYALFGDPDGDRVVWHHPTPSCRLCFQLPDGGPVLAAAGICLLAIDRSGYGQSTPCPGRTVRTAGEDALQVMNELGWSEAASVGYSGGGPHALALAAVAPSRITGVTVIAGAGPAAAVSEAATAISPLTAKIFGARTAEAAVAAMREAAGPAASDPDEYLAGALDGSEDAGLVTVLRRSVHEILRNGLSGAVDDLTAINHDWGFGLDSVRCPVTLIYGRDDDRTPPAFGRWLAARLPRATLRLTSGGHDFDVPERVVVVIDAARSVRAAA
jgi:pimeloyl-ACP methyl ester carboxylesterase